MTDPGEKIKSYISGLFGEENLLKFIEFINKEPRQFLRVNTLKISPEQLSIKLKERYGIETKTIPEIYSALKVIKGNELTGKTVEHILGFYYIQGLSSMIPAIVLSPSENDNVLDLCAAPGSKTTQLAELMKNKGTLVANEIQLSRLKALVHNVERMNTVNTGIVHQRGEWLSKVFNNYFDKILVDAPCSGLGIIQKKDEVVKWWDEKKVQGLAELQLKLLVAAIKMLKPGGEIVYSTCTLTAEENELIINKVLSKYPVEVVSAELPVAYHKAMETIDGESLNPDIKKGSRIFPWETESDGFFIGKLRKTGETKSPEKFSEKKKNIKFIPFDHREIFNKIRTLSEYFEISITSFSDYKYIIKSNDIFFAAKDFHEEIPSVFERVGLRFGSIDKKGNIVIDTHAAQLLGNETNNNIIQLESQQDLKTYLDGGTIKTSGYKEGQCIIKYEDYILGTAVVTEAGIKSRFPRSKRTQEIYTDF